MGRVNFKLLALVVFLFAIFTLRQSFISPPAVNPDHAFNTEAAFERLERILGDEAPHPVDSDTNDAVRDRLVAEIEALGFTPIVRDDFHCNQGRRGTACARVQNVMFWLGKPGPDAVMIASHYDSVPTGPGAADDGAGVAASLEIARVLRERSVTKPVLVLITDGEEIGLVGAASFVESDLFAPLIRSVISMEARGVRGPVAMFETSQPNSYDIEILKSDIKKPVASSLAADVYATMPNGTDVTEYLALDIDVGNYAIGHGAGFYHTPRDNLAMLDKRSLFHMGANGLAGVEAFLTTPKEADEKQRMYMDVFGLFIISLPQFWAQLMSGVVFIVTFVTLFEKGKPHRLRALAFPVVATVLGVGLAFAVSYGVNFVRSEAHFASAHPWAMRGAQNAAALLGALIALRWLARGEAKLALLSSVWLWFAVTLAATFMLPGAAILFVPTLMIAAGGLILLRFGKLRAASPFLIAAGLFSVAIGVQTSALAETMLFLEYAAPFTIFLVFSFFLLVPFVLRDDSPSVSKPVLLGSAAVTAAFTLCALIVPAYSVDAPRGMSVEHVKTSDGKHEWRVAGTDYVPRDMTKIAGFMPEDGRQTALAPPLSGLTLSLTTETQDNTVALLINAPQADTLTVHIETEAADAQGTLNGQAVAGPYVNCIGRRCRDAVLELPATLDGKITVYAYRYGLGIESDRLLNSRPDWALPQHRGDRRRVSETVDLRP